jgi:sporulation protein YlmC with PRC-barrel domain
MNKRVQKWFLPVVLVLMLLVVACTGNRQGSGGGGGLSGTTTATGEDVLGTPDTSTVTETTTETITETITETGTMEPTAEVMGTATPAVEATSVDVAPAEATSTAAVTETPVVEPTTVVTGTDETRPSILAIVQVSELLDMEIRGGSDEEIGNILDVLVDENGMLQYIILDANDEALGDDHTTTMTETETTNGNFIVEGTAVALPWNNFTIQADSLTADDPDDVVLLYNGDNLGIDSTEFDMSLLDEDGYLIQDMDDSDDTPIPAEYAGLIQLSEYDDYEVMNANNENLGDVDDMLVNLREGQVVYIVMNVGGFLGIGDKSVAIPWQRLELQQTSGESDAEDERIWFLLNTTAETLEDVPDLELSDWQPMVADEDWDIDIRNYWESITE